MIRRPPSSPLFPYTTLSRSSCGRGSREGGSLHTRRSNSTRGRTTRLDRHAARQVQHARDLRGSSVLRARAVRRSEEHTSELQSLAYLVCRLLLEKKKKDDMN